MLTPINLLCEHFPNPLGIDIPQPRLSWQLQADQRGARQTAYHLQVFDVSGTTLWDTDKVVATQSLLIPYAGPTLQPSQRCTWHVRVWDENDTPSAWSDSATWEMGLLDSANWQGDWITPGWDEDTSHPQPAPILRTEFGVNGEVAFARVYATSLGLYELHLNGQRVGDGQLTPGWTSYKHRIQYQSYDVTNLLQPGNNALGAMLGDGWFRGHLGFQRQRNLYGDKLALLCQLQITYVDGHTQTITSNDNWKATPGPIRMTDLYWGEHYDAQQETPGWNMAGYDDSAWSGVRVLDHNKSIIVAQRGPFVKRQEELRPQRIFQSPKGETILDFGQNMVGWVRLRVSGPAGTTITIRHAEVLDQEGNLYTENLRFAKQELVYRLKGATEAQREEIYEPHFTFYGFQFIAVDGFPGEPTLDNFTGIVVHSEMAQIGEFTCSNPMINQLQHNILWGQKGNFVDVPTDCPQRDERLGWTGDAQAFIRTACFNMDVAAFFTKWLADLRADTRPDGAVPFVVPDVMTREDGGFNFFGGSGAAAWSDAVTICPWTLYLIYGDRGLLAENYATMVGWVEWMRSKADADLIWRKGFQFGDWLDYRGSFALKPSPVTNDELVGTAFFAYSAELTAQSAAALGNTADAEKYRDLANQVRAAFNREFVTTGGRVGPNSQTAYVLALHFDLLAEENRPLAAARLAQILEENVYHLTTGFVGTPYLCHVLSRYGQTATAYELLNQESYPSWLYPVKKGATTIWERWDGIKPDGSFQDAGMNSFNHYAYGAIGEWLYRTVAGIEVDPAAPGYQHTLFQPQPGGGLTHVKATLQSPYGLVESAWELTDNDFRLHVVVPPNARGTVRLPAGQLDQVTEGDQPLDGVDGIGNVTVEDGVATIEVGAGSYDFVTTGLTLMQAMADVKHIAGRLDRYSTVGDLLADERGKAVLEEELGAAMFQNPGMRMVMGQPLLVLERFAPGVVNDEVLARIEGALVG